MKSFILFLLFTTVLSFLVFASDEKKEETVAKEKPKESTQKAEVQVAGNQTICPVSGKKVDAKFSVDFQGSRIKFCSVTCEATFLKAPEDGFKKIASANETVDSIQTNCPASGDALENHNKFTELPGRKIYFCCGDCIGDFNKDKDNMMKKLPGVTVKDSVKENATDKKKDK